MPENKSQVPPTFSFRRNGVKFDDDDCVGHFSRQGEPKKPLEVRQNKLDCWERFVKGSL